MDKFIDALDPRDTPFLNMIGRLPEIGEKDRYGRTLLGFTEVDETEKQCIFEEWSRKRDVLTEMYTEQGFQPTDDPEHDGYYEPIQTPESLALKEEVDALWYRYTRMVPQPIWDRSIGWSRRMEWGMSFSKGYGDDHQQD